MLLHGPQTLPQLKRSLDGKNSKSVENWTKDCPSFDAPGKRNHGALRRGKLVVVREDEDGVDRVHLGPGLGLVLAVSVGGEHLNAALIDAAGVEHCTIRAGNTPRQLRSRPSDVMARIREVVQAVLRSGLEDPGLCVPHGDKPTLALIGVTVAWATRMDRDTAPVGDMLGPEWRDQTFREHLSAALGPRVPLARCHAINDANAGAISLSFDQGADAHVGPALCVLASAGIGLGTVHQALRRPGRRPFVDAHLVGGARGVAGELGHCRLDPAVVSALSARGVAAFTARKRQGEQLDPLDPDSGCECAPGAVGHLEAIFGAEAVLRRLGRYEEGDSLVEGLAALDEDADGDPAIRWALTDAGRGIGSVLAGVIAGADPSSIAIIGALGSEHVCAGINEELKARDVGGVEAKRYLGENRDLLAVRGAGLAVLRSGVHRGFFENATYRWQDDTWSGWKVTPRGAQTGKLPGRPDAAWAYAPLTVDEAFVADLAAHRSPAGAKRQARTRR